MTFTITADVNICRDELCSSVAFVRKFTGFRTNTVRPYEIAEGILFYTISYIYPMMKGKYSFMEIILELLDLKNAKDIYDFEIINRIYFEKVLSSRGDDYYVPEKYDNIIRDIIEEQNRGECFMYVIRGKTGTVIGRINFTSVKTGKPKTAELGYRIGQADAGKGIATKAVQLALRFGKEEHGLEEVIAGTSAENIASQKVLEKNGFAFIGIAEKYMQINGKWVDSKKYVKYLSQGRTAEGILFYTVQTRNVLCPDERNCANERNPVPNDP